MRRVGGNFEIVVEAPSKGLVTRLPGDLPDLRAALVGESVRFENGGLVRAPGYGRFVTNPILDSFPTLIFQSSLTKNGQIGGGNYVIIGTTQKIWTVSRYPVGTPIYFWTVSYKEYELSGSEVSGIGDWTITYKEYALSGSEVSGIGGWTIST